ncbi:MAG: hypothetical protein D6698_13130, partial [Gammaproteobacteria bacterium]
GQVLPLVLIDVADYTHVPNGPATLLVGHRANIFIDEKEDTPGLVLQAKAEMQGGLKERITEMLGIARQACEKLEQEPVWEQGSGHFDLQNFEFVSNDRLLLPNTDEGANEILPVLQSLGQVERIANDPRERLTIRVSGIS